MKIKITPVLILLLLSAASTKLSAQYSSVQKIITSDMSTVYGTAPFHNPGATGPAPEQVVCFSSMMATPGKFDIAILKIDSSGFITANKILTKNPNFHDWARGLVKLGDHYYLTGSSRGFDTSSSSYESTYIVKFNSGLNILSHTNYFLPNREIFASAVTATADNNLLITGTTIFNSNRAAFLLKTDTTGNIIWFREYATPVDLVYVRELSNGDIMACGSLSFTFQFIQPVAMRFNSNGNLLWAMNFVFATGPFDYQNSALEFIHGFSNGNVLLAGRTDYSGFSLGFMDSYAIMMNEQGNILWSKVFGEFQNDWPMGYSFTSDNNLVITGSTGSFFNFSNFGFIQVIDTSGALVSAYALGDTSSQEQLSLTSFRQTTAAKNLALGIKSNLGVFNFYAADFASTQVGLCPVYSITFNDTNASYPANTFGVTTDSTLTPYTNNDGFTTYTGINETWLCNLVTSSDDIEDMESNLTVYPNPAMDELIVRSREFGVETVEVYNALGEKILSQQPNAGSHQEFVIDVSGIEPGIYFLKLTAPAGRSATEKIIVTRF